MTEKSMRLRSNRATGTWLALTVAMSMLICSGVVALHISQQRALDGFAYTVGALRQARIDLYQGFLHVSLGDERDSPWQREQGVALMDQALADLGDLAAQLPVDAAAARESAARVRLFRTLLHNKMEGDNDPRHNVELRASFHQVETMVMRLDTEARDRLRAIRVQQQHHFEIVLVLAAILLAGISAGLILAGRRQDQAEAARRAAVRRAEAEYSRFAKIFDVTPAATSIVTADGDRYLAVNDAYERIFGYKREELIGRTVPEMNLWAEPAQRDAFIRKLRAGQRVSGYEFKLLHRSGEVRDGLLSTDTFEFMGQPCLLTIVSDITERKRYEAQINYLATHDALTGLPNRNLAGDRLEQAMALARRSQTMVGALFIDLDRFKTANDGYGHGVGDALLQETAQRLGTLLREGDTLARLNGDEFLLVLAGLEKTDEAFIFARQALAALAESYLLSGHKVHVTASIGISLFPADGQDFDTLIANADIAMGRAKALGGNTCQFFTVGMSEETRLRIELETRLRAGLPNGELSLVYQPKVDMANGGIFGCEALARWHHPQLGSISPAQFIPLAEESGLIVPIGDWVLRTACAAGKAWQDAGLPPIVVSVNLSVRQIQQQDVVAWVRRTIEEVGLAPQYLELELTESLIAEDTEKVIATVKALRSDGVHFSIDDFGTGYSSLSYLRRFHVGTLKVDQSFVRGMLTDTADAAIVRAVITLAHNLGMTAIAEGVETDEQYQQLKAQHCDAIQGYYFSKPLPPEEFVALVRSGRTLSS